MTEIHIQAQKKSSATLWVAIILLLAVIMVAIIAVQVRSSERSPIADKAGERAVSTPENLWRGQKEDNPAFY